MGDAEETDLENPGGGHAGLEDSHGRTYLDLTAGRSLEPRGDGLARVEPALPPGLRNAPGLEDELVIAGIVREVGRRLRAAFETACARHEIHASLLGQSGCLRFRFEAQAGVDADWLAKEFFRELRVLGVNGGTWVYPHPELADHLDELDVALDTACRRLQCRLVEQDAYVCGGLPFGFPDNDPRLAARGLAVNRYPARARVAVEPGENQVAILFEPQPLGKITSVGFFVPTLLRGDFTATSRYHLGELETGDDVACFALYAMDQLQVTCFYVQRMVVNGQPQHVAGHMAGELQSKVPIGGTSGEWRVMRRGRSLTTWHRIDGEWVQLGSYTEAKPRDMMIGAKLWSIVDCGRMEAFVTDLKIEGEMSAEQMATPGVAPDLPEEPPPHHDQLTRDPEQERPDPVGQTAKWMTRARNALAYGGLSSPVEGVLQYESGTLPQFADTARGCWLFDSTGHGYIDWINGRGPVVLGHRRPEIEAAITAQLRAGPMLSLMNELEVEVAELLQAMIPCAERVAFGKNGSDVTTAAVRIARAATGRERILQCGFHGFHGWYIGLLGCAGIPAAEFGHTHPFAYDDLAALEQLLERHAGEVAAVILEPTSIAEPSAGYLEGVRRLASEHGALSIFDEMVTGFRLAPGGAQELFDVVPDLACFGKGLANGMPLSALTGKAEFMQHLPSIGWGMTCQGETLSLAAARAALGIYREQPVAEHLARVGERVRAGFREARDRLGLNCELGGPAARMTVRFEPAGGTSAEGLMTLFVQECLKRDLLTNGNLLASYAHDDVAVALTVSALEGSLTEVARVAAGETTLEELLCDPHQPGSRSHSEAARRASVRSIESARPPYGYVETIEARAGELHVAGWLLDLEGAFDSVELERAGAGCWPTRPVERPDLEAAFSTLEGARHSGFVGVLPLGDESLDRGIELAVLGRRPGRADARRPVRLVGNAAPPPEPPAHLMDRVTGSSSYRMFSLTGSLTCADLLHHLRPFRAPESIGRFLDWGCGCGRLTHHLMQQLPRAEAVGIDRDPEMIDWLSGELASGTFTRGPDTPPLDEYPEGHFDVIFAISVLDHLSRGDQDVWLRELRRLLAPGGLLVATTHGPHAAARQFQPRILADLDEHGIFDGLGDPELSAIVPRPYHCAAFQTTEYTRQTWGAQLEIVEHVEAGVDSFKDLWILVRR